MERPLGQIALYESLALAVPPPAIRSYATTSNRRTVQEGLLVREYYSWGYATDDAPVSRLRFALRYEPLDLGVLAAVFRALGPEPILDWVRAEPSGAYSRRAWFLYEFLTGQELDLPPARAGNYVEALDPKLNLVAERRNSTRHRVANNLLGVPGLCPSVRLTPAIAAHLATDLAAEARRLTEACDPAVLAHAVNYLYTKETRSSFALEGEAPGATRAGRFVWSRCHAAFK